jgi:Tetratricopeptide repeat
MITRRKQERIGAAKRIYDVSGSLEVAPIAFCFLLVASIGCALLGQVIGEMPRNEPVSPLPTPFPMRLGEAEAVLEDGGKPVSRPDFVYSDSCIPSAWGPATPCVVHVYLKGFREAVAPVSSIAKTTVVLRRLGAEGEPSPKRTVEVGALRVTPAAHKAYAKGEAAMGLHDVANAERWFRAAVAEYPGHALAWDELGLALEELGKPQEARSAYLRSVEADPRLARPLVHLAGLAIAAESWEEAASFTARAIALAPGDFPRAWYYDALANFALERLEQTESSARRAIDLDSEHAFPAAEYVLGVALAASGNSGGASWSLHTYLKLAPRGEFAEPARRRLAEITAESKR